MSSIKQYWQKMQLARAYVYIITNFFLKSSPLSEQVIFLHTDTLLRDVIQKSQILEDQANLYALKNQADVVKESLDNFIKNGFRSQGETRKICINTDYWAIQTL